jgi:hypothetical protein
MEDELAFVVCLSENKANICDVGETRVVTPLQRRHTFLKKETTRIRYVVYILVILLLTFTSIVVYLLL